MQYVYLLHCWVDNFHLLYFVLASLSSLLFNTIPFLPPQFPICVLIPSLLPSPSPLQPKTTTLQQESMPLKPSTDVATVSSAFQPPHTASPQSGVGKTPSKPSPLTTSVSAVTQSTSSGGEADVGVASTSVCERDNLYDHVALNTKKESVKSSLLAFGASAPVQAESNQKAETSRSDPPISGGGLPSTEDDPLSLVLQIFSNWPCAVATILGYTPNCLHSAASINEQGSGSESLSGSEESLMKPGHVTVLDAFLQKLLYSANTQLINTFFTTVIEKVAEDLQRDNAARYFQKEDGSYSFEEIPLHKGTLGLVVGSVLVRALVRLLTVEHSRPTGASSGSLNPTAPNEASDNAEEEDLGPPPPPPPPPGRRQHLSQSSSMEEKARNVYSLIK